MREWDAPQDGRFSEMKPESGLILFLSVMLFSIYLSTIIYNARKPPFVRNMVLASSILILLGLAAGCGGAMSSNSSSNSTHTGGTPAGSYTLTVAAASGALNQTMQLMLTVD